MKMQIHWSIGKRAVFSIVIFILLSFIGLVMTLIMLIQDFDNPVLKVLLIIMTGTFIMNSLFFYKKIVKSAKETDAQFRNFTLGYDSDALNAIEYYYTDEMKKAFKKLLDLIDNQEAIKVSNKHAKYLALHNQINPHFLYNTLEAIRGDAICEGVDNIANITEALATFFRYTISNLEKIVTLEEELSNVENYFAIQNYRFGDRISIKTIFDEDDENVLQYQVPKLTLQPIIENAILHGLEPKVKDGCIEIDISRTEHRLIIKVTDDGVGMDTMTLTRVNDRLNQITREDFDEISQKKGGIALTNVNNRIKLLFGEKYGIRLSSIINFGTSVEITLPLLKAGSSS